MFKSGFITIIGRPNVGKSTLLNYLMGEKLSIVSSRPQTTRNNIQTILTRDSFQIVFVDTPGMHKPKHKLFLTTPEGEINKADLHILEQLKQCNTKVFLVVNKIDENPADRVAKTLEEYTKVLDFKEIIPISAINGKNTEKLLELVVDQLPEGPMYYPEDMITDQQERFIVMETIREKALRLLSQEVPHGIAVEILTMKKNENGSYLIEANMLCEKNSHKGIIIGKNGAMMKKISTYIEKFLGCKVNLKIWVKVKSEWRDSAFVLKELGYK